MVTKDAFEFKDLLSQNVGIAFAKQMAFANLLGERAWQVDITEGRVFFGDDLAFPIQLLGSESDGDETWLWAWANEASNLPGELLEKCNELKTLGEKYNIPQLTQRSFSREATSGHELAMLASGLNAETCYYRGPYDGGALFFLVKNLPADVINNFEPQRIISVITEVISHFDVNHSEMVKTFLSSQDYELSGDVGEIHGKKDNNVIRIQLDEQGRITNVEGSLAAKEEQPPQEPRTQEPRTQELKPQVSEPQEPKFQESEPQESKLQESEQQKPKKKSWKFWQKS